MDEERRIRIKEELKLVPLKPGCYQMHNDAGEIIYVGKAKVLKNRLSSYFTGSHDAKTTQMVSEVDHFEYIITRSETEAFLLECNFIKQYRPHYNILLMDDKTYPYICITKEDNPRLIMTRDIKKYRHRKDSLLFGPYPNAAYAKEIVEMLNKIYPFRKCTHIPNKKCLYYSLGQCLAPCEKEVKRSDYDGIIDEVTKFLNGNTKAFKKEVEQKMFDASSSLEFEKAMEYKRILDSLVILSEKQTMTINDYKSRDIFGFYVQDYSVCVQIFHMRGGKIIERNGEVFDLIDNVDDILLSYLYSFYEENPAPKEILIPYIEDYQILSELTDLELVVPVKGLKKQLVDLVCENAKNNLDKAKSLKMLKMAKTKEPLYNLAELLKINYPKVIELFDNSNIQGASAVSAMVAYIDGVKSPKDYRKYNVKTVVGADDYHTMQEVLKRRYQKVLNENLRKPNLLIVDGGALQVKAALQVFKELGISDIDIMGLEKDDHHRTRAIVSASLEEIEIDKHSNLFLLLEAMQDEVHRFAVSFFTNKHQKNTYKSVLDEIPGLGERRKKTLLASFESFDEMKDAPIEKFKALGIPVSVAEELKKKLNEE